MFVQVEEMVLSQLAWTSGSPLFDALDAAGSVPSYKDVALPSVAGVGRSVASPLIHPRVLKLGAKVLESPLSALHDRHTSPGSNARRALFTPGGTIRSSPIPIAPKPPPQAKGGVTVQVFTDSLKKKLQQGAPSSPNKDPPVAGEPAACVAMEQVEVGSSVETSPHGGTSILTTITLGTNFHSPPQATPPTLSTHLPLGVADHTHLSTASTILSPSKAPPSLPGNIRPVIPTSPPIPSVTVSQTTPLRGQGVMTPGPATSPRPKRTGSLALFYRKAYQLAYIRIKDLCERLGQTPDFTQK